MSNGEIRKGRAIKEAVVHHMPCEIQYTGDANVSDYFVVNSDNEIKESMFRGRLLKGEVVHLPKEVSGYVISKTKERSGEHTYELEQSFNEVTEWFTDGIPEQKDEHAIQSCLEWMRLMNEIHSSFLCSSNNL